MLRKIHIDTCMFSIKYIEIRRDVNEICCVAHIHANHTRYVYICIYGDLHISGQIHWRVVEKWGEASEMCFVSHIYANLFGYNVSKINYN